MIARITTNTPEEAATLLESLRTQGYSAEIIAPCEIEIQYARGSSTATCESAPVIPLPVEQFVFSDYQSPSTDEAPVREFVLMPLFRKIGVEVRNFSGLVQNAGHAAAFAFRNLLREMARRRREAGEWRDKQLTLSPPRSAEWSAWREKLLRLQPEMRGAVIVSLVLTLLIVYGRHISSEQTAQTVPARSNGAAINATSSTMPALPKGKRTIAVKKLAKPQAAPESRARTSALVAKKPIRKPVRARYLDANYVAEDEVIVRRYPAPKKTAVMARGVARYSDLE